MMPCLEDGALHLSLPAGKDVLLLFLFCIARKHHGEIAKDKTSDDGLVVRIVLIALDTALLNKRCRWSEHLKYRSAAEIHSISRTESLACSPLRLQLFHIANVDARR